MTPRWRIGLVALVAGLGALPGCAGTAAQQSAQGATIDNVPLRHLVRRGDSTMPHALSSELAREAYQRGVARADAVFEFCLSAGGEVDGVRALQSSGYPWFDQGIIKWIWRWKFRPYRVDGVAHPVCSAVTINWRNGDCPGPHCFTRAP